MADQYTPLRQPPWPDAPLVVTLPDGRFTKHERWAWARIARGLMADMSRYPGDSYAEDTTEWLAGITPDADTTPDIEKPETFREHHLLSEIFLRTIIFHQPYAHAPEGPAVSIKHARISDEIHWAGRAVESQLRFYACRFESEVNFQRLRIVGLLSLRGSLFEKNFSADGLSVTEDVFLSDDFRINGDLRLIGARIGGDLGLSGAKIKGALEADGISVTGGIFCNNGFVAEGDVRLIGAQIGGIAAFMGAKLNGALVADGVDISENLFCSEDFSIEKEVRLLGARVGGLVSFIKATVRGQFTADGISVGGNLFCCDGFVAEGDVRLLGAQIGGDAAFIDSTIKGVLKADNARFTNQLFLRQMVRIGDLNLTSAVVGGDIQLGLSKIEGLVDMTGARIGGALELAQLRGSEPNWTSTARLILRNVTAGALAGGLAAFRVKSEGKTPGQLVQMDLSGFHYARLGGVQSQPGDTLADAPSAQLVKWLESGIGDGKAFTPGPFRQLARELADSGHTDKARAVTRGMFFHYRRCTRGLRALPLYISGMLTGFGFRNYYALFWFVAIVAAATGYGLWLTDNTHVDLSTRGVESFLSWLWFSFGNAVPLITLDEAHKTFLAERYFPNAPVSALPDVPARISTWFYLEKTLGFLILTYLAASVSGLANRGKD